MSGRKYKVTADDPRYTEWSNRKPSKRSKLQEKILSQPGEYAAERARKVAEQAAGNVLRTTTRTLRPAAGAALAAAAPYAASIAAAVATVGALAAGWVIVARAEKRLAADRITQISNEFVAAQRQLMKQFGVGLFSQVPSEPRLKLLNAYKQAIADVQVYHAGSIQPSKQIPYGR